MDAEGENSSAPLLESVKEDDELQRICTKLERRIVPLLFLVTMLSYVDRGIYTLAAIGMEKEIGFTKLQYGISVGFFYTSYVLFQIPSGYILPRVGPPVCLGVSLVGCSIAASLTAFAQNAVQLYLLRLLLGMCMAGTFPGLNYHVSLFFPECRRVHALGIVYAGMVLGMGAIGPVGAALLKMDGLMGMSGWRWMLFIEAVPSGVLGLLLFWMLPKNPAAAKFLSQQELKNLERYLEKPDDDQREEKSTFMRLKGIISNGRLTVIIVGVSMFSPGRFAAFFWTPFWIDAMVSGQSHNQDGSVGSGNEVEVALLTTLPYVFASLAGVAIGRSSVYFQDRKFHCVGLAISASVAFVLLPFGMEWGLIPGLVILSIAHGACNSITAPTISLETSLLAKADVAFGMAWVNTVICLCALLGPPLAGFVVDRTGSYDIFLYLAGSACFVGGLFYLAAVDSLHVRRNGGTGAGA